MCLTATEVSAMQFQIQALPATQFQPLFGQPDEYLAERGVIRMQADKSPGFPCRVSLQDAEIGETVLLLNYEHQPATTPYRATHAIFVREHAIPAQLAPGEIPALFRERTLSVRAFDNAGMMLTADLATATELQSVIHAMFANPQIAYLHLHYAKPGCFAARVERMPG
jgi:hypothetical protein